MRDQSNGELAAPIVKRSVACEGHGVPLGVVSAGAHRRDSALLAPTLAAAKAQVGPLPEHVTRHLDAAYDTGVTRTLLLEMGFEGIISRKGVPAPVQVGNRWIVERTHSWMNGYGNSVAAPTGPAPSSTSSSSSTSPPRSSPSVN